MILAGFEHFEPPGHYDRNVKTKKIKMEVFKIYLIIGRELFRKFFPIRLSVELFKKNIL